MKSINDMNWRDAAMIELNLILGLVTDDGSVGEKRRRRLIDVLKRYEEERADRANGGEIRRMS